MRFDHQHSETTSIRIYLFRVGRDHESFHHSVLAVVASFQHERLRLTSFARTNGLESERVGTSADFARNDRDRERRNALHQIDRTHGRLEDEGRF